MLRFVLGVIALFFVSQTYAGSIGFTAVSSYMDWEPDCYKPTEPSYFVSDIESYNMAVDQYNSYLADVEDYLQCVRSEAESDIQTLANAISNGVDEKKSEILDEVESSKSDLQLQSSLLY